MVRKANAAEEEPTWDAWWRDSVVTFC